MKFKYITIVLTLAAAPTAAAMTYIVPVSSSGLPVDSLRVAMQPDADGSLTASDVELRDGFIIEHEGVAMALAPDAAEPVTGYPNPLAAVDDSYIATPHDVYSIVVSGLGSDMPLVSFTPRHADEPSFPQALYLVSDNGVVYAAAAVDGIYEWGSIPDTGSGFYISYEPTASAAVFTFVPADGYSSVLESGIECPIVHCTTDVAEPFSLADSHSYSTPASLSLMVSLIPDESFVRIFSNEVTHIGDIDTAAAAASGLYDMAGRRVSDSTAPGIYVDSASRRLVAVTR